jgi:hypothetical protein
VRDRTDVDRRALLAWHAYRSSTAYNGESKSDWIERWMDERVSSMNPGHPGLTYRRHELYGKQR